MRLQIGYIKEGRPRITLNLAHNRRELRKHLGTEPSIRIVISPAFAVGYQMSPVLLCTVSQRLRPGFRSCDYVAIPHDVRCCWGLCPGGLRRTDTIPDVCPQWRITPKHIIGVPTYHETLGADGQRQQVLHRITIDPPPIVVTGRITLQVDGEGTLVHECRTARLPDVLRTNHLAGLHLHRASARIDTLAWGRKQLLRHIASRSRSDRHITGPGIRVGTRPRFIFRRPGAGLIRVEAVNGRCNPISCIYRCVQAVTRVLLRRDSVFNRVPVTVSHPVRNAIEVSVREREGPAVP